MDGFLPNLPTGYIWQLARESGDECTGDYYAESDAYLARIWAEGADEPEIELTRTGAEGFWGREGLKRWAIASVQVPDGLMDWEEFETLSEVARRIKLESVEV